MPSPNPSDINLLISAVFRNSLVNFDFRCGGDHKPYAVKTKLGWVLMGDRTFKKKNRGTISKTDPILMTKDEKISLTILESTNNFKDGRYEVGLLWKEDIVNLPYNRNLPVKRLERIEKKSR